MIETFILLYIGVGIGVWFMVFCEEEMEYEFDSISWWGDRIFDFVFSILFMWIVFVWLKAENAQFNHRIRNGKVK